MKQNIKGMLSLEELEELVKREEIDTVLMVFTDLYGRFMGKRYDAEFFLEEGAGLLACAGGITCECAIALQKWCWSVGQAYEQGLECVSHG